MYREKAVRNDQGEIMYQRFQSSEAKPAHILPNRKWFMETRTADQNQLENFRTEMAKTVKNPYEVVMHQHKVPMNLINHTTSKPGKVDLLSVESFQSVFGPKKTRKRPKLSILEVDELGETASEKFDNYESTKDRNIKIEVDSKDAKRAEIFEKGTSKRIWGELYKVVDSSDVIVQVLDARDPMGTRSKHIEEQMKKDRRHKQLIFILNKCDLIPTWATARWVKVLSKEFPTLAFHSSITNPFGKGSLIQLLRQFSRLHSDKKQISVGFIGYPNVGKSSIINTMKGKKVCKVAPIPGETKVWQYITLMKKIFLIDCPGIVYPTGDTETDLVLKGVVRVENIPDPADHIPTILEKVKKEYIQNTYGIYAWENAEDFLEQVARKSGRLLKGGDPDINTVARMVLNDWQRGKIPYFACPPFEDGKPTASQLEEGGEGENAEKEKESEQNQRPQVLQTFHKIPVRQKFMEPDEELKKLIQQDRDDTLNWDDLYRSAKDESDIEESDVEEDENEVSAEIKEEEVDDNEGDNAIEGDDVVEGDEDKGEEDAEIKEEESEEESEQTEKVKGPVKPNQNRNKSNGKKNPKKRKNKFDDGEDVPTGPVPTKKVKKVQVISFLKDETDAEKPAKEKRMTTSKRKTGSNFYEITNVKGKRDRKKEQT